MAANLSNQGSATTEQSKITTTEVTTPTLQPPADTVAAAAPTTSSHNPFEDPPTTHTDNNMTTPTGSVEHTSTEPAAPVAPAIQETAATPAAATTEHASIATTPAAAPAPQTPPAAATTGAVHERDSPISPQLATLKAMFPDFDDTLLLSVLESVGNDQDRAVDALLGMSDPEYRPDTRPDQPAPLSQTDLDEQFARQLMLQEQEQYQAAQWQGQPGSTPYEPRHGQRPPVQFTGRQQPQQQQQAGPQKDTMAEFQDQFNKFAETGKKTIGSFISKVKAKINEMDQPRPNQGQSSYSGSAAGSNSGQPPWTAEASRYGEPHQQQRSPEPLHHTLAGQAQPSYHAPEPSNEPIHLGGYDAIPAPQTGPTTTSSSATPPPPTTNTGSGAPIDGSKIGILPKRPVSLIQTNPSGTTQRPHDSDDELEYAESPFEERTDRRP